MSEWEESLCGGLLPNPIHLSRKLISYSFIYTLTMDKKNQQIISKSWLKKEQSGRGEIVHVPRTSKI